MADVIRRHIPPRGLHNCMLTPQSFEDVTNLYFFQGHEFNRSLYKAFYDLHIEDMWLPFFCNTANITTSRMEIHETGYAWRFIRKTLVFALLIVANSPPAGASMSLVGLVPPLCDNGNMLVDGGYRK